MMHTSVKAIGWVVGGPDMVLQAVLDLLTPSGTLMMLTSWQDTPYEFNQWSKERQQAYLAECPPFDPAISRAYYHELSILSEFLRTRPGAYRSSNPEASMAAIGAKAEWLTENHPLQYGYGPGSPLAKLCEAGGQVLLLGAPLETITLLHYAEHQAQIPNKRIVRYPTVILEDGQRKWVEVEEFDTSQGIVDWEGEDYFETIAKAFLASGQGRAGLVGAAPSYLFEATALIRFGIEWMEQNFR
jgi:aminoglycoside 3-N-acetyltransferase